MKKIILWTLGVLISLSVIAFLLLLTPDTNPEDMLAKYSSDTSEFLDLDSGDRIHYRDTGNVNGKVLILVHGANGSLHVWEPLIERLKSEYRLIALDLPGHGLTGPNADRDYSAKALTGAILAVMDELSVEKGIWVGNSMGGWVTWRSAISHPERVSGVVLISPSGAPLDEPQKLYLGARLLQTKIGRWFLPSITPKSLMKRSIEANYFNPSLVTDELVERYWELLRYPGNRIAAADRAKVSREPEYWDRISEIETPVLVLWGEADTISPHTLSIKYKSEIVDSEVITYPTAGHLAMEETPDDVARDVKDWIGRKF